LKTSFLALFLSTSLFSADLLEEIIVTTGTRTAKVLEETPVKTEVVTSKQIQQTHAKNVSEAIMYIPGLLIKETRKEGQSVSIQGFDSDRVLILLDGEPMTSSTGSTVDLTQLNIADIERIEVIKGASSALYGSQAMGGVVNIISKKPALGWKNSLTAEAGTYADKGADDLAVAVLRASSTYRDKDILASLFLDYRHDSGITLQEGGNYDLPKIDRLNLNAELRFLGSTEYYIKPRFYVESSTKPTKLFIPGVGLINQEKLEDVSKFRLSLGSKTEFDSGDKLKFSIFGEHYDDVSIQNKLATPYTDLRRDALIQLAQGEVQYDTLVLEEHLLTMGLDLRYESLDQTNTKTSATGSEVINEFSEDATRYAIESYLQDDYFVTEELELVLGVRYQYDSDFGSYLSPKLSALYTPFKTNKKRLNLRASYGNGYRAPSLKERFFFFDHSSLGYQVLGNPNLEPETSHSYQLSTEWIDKGSYSTAFNLFYNDITNLIEEIKDPLLSAATGLEIYQYQNINKAYTAGAEWEFNTNFWEYFNLNGGYTYLYAKDKQTNKYLVNRPEHQVKTTLSHEYMGLNSLVAVVYESKQFVDEENLLVSPAQTLIDIKMTKHVTKLLSVYGGINNILDDHQDPNKHVNDSRSKKPRYFYIGSTYKF